MIFNLSKSLIMKIHETIAELAPIIGKNLTIRPISHALTNTSYWLDNGQSQFCLRLNNPISAQLGIDRDRERTILKYIEKESWAPTILDIKHGWMLSQWKKGATFTPKNNGEIRQLGHLFSSLQNMPQKSLSSTQPINVANQIALLQKSAPALLIPFAERVTTLCDQYVFPVQPTLCFHDWHPGNLLFSAPQITLIDWEYAALGDPLIDLACLQSGFKLTLDQIELLAPEIQASEQEFENAKCLTSLMSLFWYMVRFPDKDWRDAQQKWLHRWG